MFKLKIALTGFVAMWLLSHSPAAFGAAVIKTQIPCTPIDGYCRVFSYAQTIPTIRNFSFTAPSAGTAQVTFHGSMYCSNADSNPGNGVIDIASQIVDDPNAAADAVGPGGLRHAARLMPNTGAANSTTFNLASTRVFTIGGAGVKSYRFKMTKVTMNTGTVCFVYNASFSVVFIP